MEYFWEHNDIVKVKMISMLYSFVRQAAWERERKQSQAHINVLN